MSDMAEDNARDYAFKRLLDDAVESIDAVLADPSAEHRLGPESVSTLGDAKLRLQTKAEHIVRVWS